jgi:hypothetical protein
MAIWDFLYGHVSLMSTLIAGQTHPTPPMPANATRLWTSNFLSISVIISSRPMNFESLSNGTVKNIVHDGDVRLDEFADTKTRLIRLETFKCKGNQNRFGMDRQARKAF